MIKVLLVDDHQIIIDGIKQLLEDESDIEVISTACNGVEALKQLEVYEPDLLITDISMNTMGGFELIDKANEKFENLKFLVLSMHIEDVYIKRAVSLNVSGYLPKDTSKYELVEAIHCIVKGETYFSDKVSRIIMNSMLKGGGKSEDDAEKSLEKLTNREEEIVALIMEGLSSPQIAEKLFISPRTVENHRANIMNKLKLKNTIELVRYVLENKYKSMNNIPIY